MLSSVRMNRLETAQGLICGFETREDLNKKSVLIAETITLMAARAAAPA